MRPARQSFVVELIDRKDMTNAIALNATMFNLGVVIGPAVAGLVYAWLGPAWCFTINALSFIAVIIALALMKLDNHPIPLLQSPMEQLKEGFKAAFSDKTIRLLLTNLLVVGTFGFGVLVLIPAWAVNVLHGDVTTNGLLLSARGLGSLLGGLIIATIGSRGFRGKIWTIGSFVLPVSMLVFGTATHIPFSLFMIAIVGWSIISVVNVSNALIQSHVSDEMRGRVMSFYTLIFIGGQTIGGLLTGVLAEKINEPFAVYLSAGMLALTAILTYVLKPFLRNVA